MIDVSQATLDVIEAVKTNNSVRFDYGQDIIREVKPTGFFGDYVGFEGTDERTEEQEFRRFGLERISEWLGRETVCVVHIEPIAFPFHPTWDNVTKRLQEMIDFGDLEYGVEVADDSV